MPIDGTDHPLIQKGHQEYLKSMQKNITFKNIIFKNGYGNNGRTIYWNANSGEIANSIFTNSYAQNGGAAYVPENRNIEIKSSIFDNNIAEEESEAVY